jgi:hypothetical protein
VPEAVAEKLSVTGVLDNTPRGGVYIPAGHAGPRGSDAGPLRDNTVS